MAGEGMNYLGAYRGKSNCWVLARRRRWHRRHSTELGALASDLMASEQLAPLVPLDRVLGSLREGVVLRPGIPVISARELRRLLPD